MYHSTQTSYLAEIVSQVNIQYLSYQRPFRNHDHQQLEE